MRTAIACLQALFVALVSTSPARAQAGRYLPLPGGGGGSRFVPHFFPHGAGEWVFWVIAAIVLAVAGYHVGLAIGRWLRRPPEKPGAFRPAEPTVRQAAAAPPPMRDLILQPGEVAAKATQTRLLLEFLARQDHALDPVALHKRVATTFTLVQKAWEARDYGTVRELLLPGILAEHQRLLKSMRRNHEINRVEGLRIERLEFVHLHCPQSVDEQEVTALVTFQASIYFVDDRTGRTRAASVHRVGSRSSGSFAVTATTGCCGPSNRATNPTDWSGRTSPRT
jgi:hypothetical protein